ncbi:hypothetical protein SBA3_820003 [Candidatus Sulfopaludibacter sp. SbA3]|nr:hypothetical protein SBA3_820003 [Candidatus Sulfopaludibacter sp. SbA3]
MRCGCRGGAERARSGVLAYLYDSAAGNFIPDDGSARLSDVALRGLAATPGQEVTYTAVTPGSGPRVASRPLPRRRTHPR